ncbi:MAG: phage baseplate assembly protein V [Pseudomonadota bacterium]
MMDGLRDQARRIAMMLCRGVLVRLDDNPGVQEGQYNLFSGETATRAQHMQEYGFTSHPLPGGEAVAASVAGARDHLIVLVVDDRRYRLKPLAAGEVAIYDDRGAKVHLTRDGIRISDPDRIDLDAPEIHLNAPTVTADGQPVSRITDRVQVGSGSSAGLWPLVEGADG